MGESTDNFSDQFKRNKSQQVAFRLNTTIFNKFQVKNNVEIAELNVINFNYEKEIVVNNLIQTINSIKAQYQNSEEKYTLLQSNFENQRLSFQKSEEKHKEGLMLFLL